MRRREKKVKIRYQVEQQQDEMEEMPYESGEV
jgi:hypothetical protein